MYINKKLYNTMPGHCPQPKSTGSHTIHNTNTVDFLWRHNITKIKFNNTIGYILQLSCGSYLFVDEITGNKMKIAGNQMVFNQNTNIQRSKL